MSNINELIAVVAPRPGIPTRILTGEFAMPVSVLTGKKLAQVCRSLEPASKRV